MKINSKKIVIPVLTMMLCFNNLTFNVNNIDTNKNNIVYAQTLQQTDIRVKVDGEFVSFNEDMGSPLIDVDNSRTLIPLRAVSEKFGCEVEWVQETQTAVVKKNGVKIEVPLNKDYIVVDGIKKQMDTTTIATGGRTYLSIRFVMENLGAKVDWDNENRIVIIESSKGGNDKEEVKENVPVQSGEKINYGGFVYPDYPADDYRAQKGDTSRMYDSVTGELTTYDDKLRWITGGGEQLEIINFGVKINKEFLTKDGKLDGKKLLEWEEKGYNIGQFGLMLYNIPGREKAIELGILEWK